MRAKCSELFRAWAREYKGVPGLDRVARLYKELPKRKQVVTQERSKVIRETENPFGDDEDDDEDQQQQQQAQAQAQAQASSSRAGQQQGPQLFSPVSGQISSFSYAPPKEKGKGKKKDRDKKDKKKQRRKFDLEAEKDQMKTTIAESSIAATNLNNAMQSINRERERISENPTAVAHFEACKQLRRKILRYVSAANAPCSYYRARGCEFLPKIFYGKKKYNKNSDELFRPSVLTRSPSRSTTSSPNSGSAASYTPTTSSSCPS